MSKLIETNIYNDDKLIELIKSTFNETDLEIFIISYNLYKQSKEINNDYFIDFDKIYKFIGFTRKDNAKRL
jgi:hypothetical protein